MRPVLLFAAVVLMGLSSQRTSAQQLLGSIEGSVTDPSGAAIAKVEVKARNLDTNLEQSTTTSNSGAYRFFNLPIGRYSVEFNATGFQLEKHSPVQVQANRTSTENAALKVGSVTTAVDVTASNQLNQVDTTNGYVLGDEVIQNTPLGTGSFTQLAILSPGVNADLLGGSGSNGGLGNQAIWANGQRDTSNSFTLNAISGNNLFNGKTSSQVSSNRTSLNTGENFSNSTGEIGTSTSVYDAIGQALPSPPIETIEELRVNTSMYDASQGASSGAHIGIITKSGTNAFHGQVYEYFQNSFWNARPFFYRLNEIIPGSPSVPPLHYNRFGATFGGPIIKNKLFFFTSYQGIRVSDSLLATSQASVPLHLTNDRSAAAIANVANMDFPGSGVTANSIDPVALALLQQKNKDGSYFIPTPQITDSQTAANLGYDALVPGPPSRFTADQANFNLDYTASEKDHVAAKYYYQHAPTTNPFASQGGGQSSSGGLLGFPQQLDSGSQTVSIDNTWNVRPNFVWEQRIGYVHEKAFSRTSQDLTPQQFGINLFGSKAFPGFTIDNNSSSDPNSFFQSFQLAFGPVSNFANAGMFQNRYTAATDLNVVRGRHNLSFGFNWDYLQLNIHNLANQVAGIEFFDFPGFLTAQFRTGQEHTVLFNGVTNRHYRANEAGGYAQDNVKLTSNLNLTVGVRFDWDGPLSEKNGLLTNFDPNRYSYDLATDTVNNIGLVVAGNNKTFGTKGVSNSTLTGRQWGFAPRLGLVWSPPRLHNVVFRAGFGMFYDRGQFFTEYSPSAGFGFNGPFGVTLEPPFTLPFTNTGTSLSAPFGTTPPPPPPKDLSSVIGLVPNQAGLIGGSQPFLFGGYNPKNQLPYSENWTLDMQWQPREDVVLSVGYAGNHGVHLTQPIPFNQPRIATPQSPVNGQIYSYGYTPFDHNDPICQPPSTTPCPSLVTEQINTSTGGNTDLRAPFVGYSPNSVFWTANAISNYNALLIGVTKRLKHGLQLTGAYTWSHTLDEQSGLGLFYNGNNPLQPKQAYASSDFDRTHVASLQLFYELPTFVRTKSFTSKLANGWGLSTLFIAQSGQPYNVYDFSGSLGAQYYSANDFLTNPVVPLAPGQTPQTATAHGNASTGAAFLDPNAFAIPQLQPGQNGVPPCGPTTTGNNQNFCDTVENAFSNGRRNIFRGLSQIRVDLSILKNTKITERVNLKYSADFFNLANHASFDTPNNNVTFNPCFNPDPCYTFPPNGSLGVIQHTLGSPRFIQMSLHLEF
jgi:Carboxypeptidase regulatory-like domain/TonB dependent receptor